MSTVEMSKEIKITIKSPAEDVDWDSFNFSLNNVQVDTMWLNVIENGAEYSSNPEICLRPLSPLALHPACTVLNYGQVLFEGLKAFRRADGRVCIFRPDRNAKRILDGAERLCIPPVPSHVFIDACAHVIKSNSHWIPPYGKGALYLRPLLFGSGAALGVKPSHEYTFCIYCSPVGNYFKGALKCISLQAVRGTSRSAPGGVGSVKASGNYAPCFMVQKEVRERGYDEVLFLDAVNGEYIEEAGASNFFVVLKDGRLVTPSLGTILPGITRSTIIELAKEEFECEVEERPISLKELKDATEAFCCGTGASITPVGKVHLHQNNKDNNGEELDVTFGDRPGNLTSKLYEMLLSIQMGTAEEDLSKKYDHWLYYI